MERRRPWTGPIIRLLGVALLGIAASSARSLFRRAATPPDALDYLLALIAFACASPGAAMAFLGAHLFDQIEVSPRWRRLS